MMARTGRPETSIRKRFIEKIVFDELTECWNWGGAAGPQGYGFIKRKDGTQLRAHRFAYELANGPIPPGMFVCHTCDNPSCVRPSHLFLGSHQDNMTDMAVKGRAARMFGDRNGSSQLGAGEVLAIREAEGAHRVIAERFGVSASNVGLIKRRQRWTHL